MRTFVVALLLCCAQTLFGSELTLFYTAGWSPDYTLRIDFATGQLAYNTKETAFAPTRKTLKNYANVETYVKTLLARIPADSPGGIIGDDAPRYMIEFRDGATRRNLIIGYLAPPGAIHLNEGYSAAEELEQADAFAKSINSYFLCSLLSNIAKSIAPKE